MKKILISIVPMIVLLTYCSVDTHHESLVDKVKKSQKKYVNTELQKKRDRLDRFKTVPSQLKKDGNEFQVTARKHIVNPDGCVNCHADNTLLKPELSNKPEIQRAHWNINLNHGNAVDLQCMVCHDHSNNMALKNLTGKTIGFDHSYKLCQQCHQQEVEDWVGGAHGQRASGWGGARIVKNCAECHNPHDPGFHKQWPEVIMPDMRSKE